MGNKYLTKLISDCYGIIFMSRYLREEWNRMNHWDDVYREDEIVTEFTFGKSNVLSMEKLCSRIKNSAADMIQSLCKDNPADGIVALDDEKDSEQLFRNAVGREGASCVQILNTFLKYSNLKDEELAEAGKERYFGLSTLRIKNILEEGKELKDNQRSELYGEMIRCMDTGTASVSIKKMRHNGKVYYGAVLNSGEHRWQTGIY